MNRIYQGRVSKIEIKDSEGNFRNVPVGSPDTCPLWRHHRIFQDAVNYYLVALGALAGTGSENAFVGLGSKDRVIHDLYSRLFDSWERFPRDMHGASSLRDSLRRTLPGLSERASLQDAFDAILSGNEANARERVLSLLSLIQDLGGDIQKGSKRYFPFFCEPATKATFPRARVGLLKVEGKDFVPRLLWSSDLEIAPDQVVEQLKFEYFANPNESVQPIEGNEARVRLIEALDNPQLGIELPIEILSDLRKRVHLIETDIRIPRYFFGGAGAELRKFRLDLFLIAAYVTPDPSILRALRNSFKEPSASKSSKKKDETEEVENLLRSLGDDPLILARGERGFVFPSFTSLPTWVGANAQKPIWRDFDIAAFAEALKSLNQFTAKTEEREEKLKKAEETLHYMLGISDAIPRSSDSETEEQAPSRPGKDPRWPLVAQLEKELGENLSEGTWQLSRSAMRGLRDIIGLWRKHPGASVVTLQKDVKTYQADEKHKREIGSVQLFLLLCEERYHALWQTETDDERGDESEENDDPARILSDAIEVHQIRREVERFREPIRLTPAEPVFSRRLFMFSDLTDKLAKVKFGETTEENSEVKSQFVEAAIALKEGENLKEARVRITFSAPRLHRDELLGGAESRWLQPITAALGFSNPAPSVKFDSAVALMPDHMDDGRIRHLLNFPVNFDSAWLHQSIGKADLWKSQFNGTKDKNLHLHWAGTARDTTRKNTWWENRTIIENGFTVLSNDLGQRSAGAWALLKVTCSRPDTKHPVRSIGHDGTREWFATVLATGIHRLPGEDQRILKNGKWATEQSGKKGRNATFSEYEAACVLAKNLGCESVENWLGMSGEKSYPALNDQLVKIANRRITRLGTYHRWSCFSPEKFEDPARRANVIGGQLAELSAYQDENVTVSADILKSGDFEGFRHRAGAAFEALRTELEVHLVNLANLTAPLRQKVWSWQKRPDSSGYGDLLMVDLDDCHPKIRGQRGLSMARLEQLEGLRRLFLRYNRSLDRSPGIPAKFGREDVGRTSGEPCQALLVKIDRMKEQRVNQTAHLILAQALGVRLCPHRIEENERKSRDLHGEYEKIPGREPVDFIVIEDLSRYLSSQGRAPSENSRLMKWAHRAVRDKLKMLAEEPFGIPVVETVPAYSSRFHALNGQAGSRLHELHELEAYQQQSLINLAAKTDFQNRDRSKAAGELFEQFQALAKLNERRRAEGKKVPRTLYYPKSGGPLFLASRDGDTIHADVNAAINLGLRAIAAPACIDIHRRLRATKEKEVYRPRVGNAREKSAFSKDDIIQPSGAPSKKFASSSSPNFFYEPEDLKQANGEPLFDRAMFGEYSLVSGVSLWSMVNNAIYIRCVELNRTRLHGKDPDDQIPM